MTEIGSEQAFDDIVQKTDKLVVVDFATTWCGPCKVMEPKMNQISEEYTDAEFYKVVGDASADASKLMKREGVRTVPSFHFWKGNSRVEVINGANIDGIVLGVANTAEMAAGQTNVDVYPNPSLGEFAVELNGFSGVATLEVHNIVGRKVWTSTAQGEGAIQRIDLGALEAGNYLISVFDDVTKVTRRVTLLD